MADKEGTIRRELSGNSFMIHSKSREAPKNDTCEKKLGRGGERPHLGPEEWLWL